MPSGPTAEWSSIFRRTRFISSRKGLVAVEREDGCRLEKGSRCGCKGAKGFEKVPILQVSGTEVHENAGTAAILNDMCKFSRPLHALLSTFFLAKFLGQRDRMTLQQFLLSFHSNNILVTEFSYGDAAFPSARDACA